MQTVYLIGSPGVGKTTLIKELTKDWFLSSTETTPVKHLCYATPFGSAIELGHRREPFGGTDTLAYDAINKIEQWLPKLERIDFIIGEGDRLANTRFITLCQQLGKVHLYHLTTKPETSAQRRAKRAQEFGTANQNESWVKGRTSKHENLAKKHNAIALNANLQPSMLARIILADIAKG